MLVRVVDQHRELFGADFLGSVAKHKEQGIDDVGFATAIGPDDTRETLHAQKGIKVIFKGKGKEMLPKVHHP